MIGSRATPRPMAKDMRDVAEALRQALAALDAAEKAVDQARRALMSLAEEEGPPADDGAER